MKKCINIYILKTAGRKKKKWELGHEGTGTRRWDEGLRTELNEEGLRVCE